MSNARRMLLPLVVAGVAALSAEVAPAPQSAADVSGDASVRIPVRAPRRRGLADRKRVRLARLALSAGAFTEHDLEG